MDAETLRLLLAGFLVAMYILAMFYLRRRKISLGEYTFLGLFALFIPALGPFLVIISRPGNIKHNGHEGEKVYRMQLTLCDPLPALAG